MNTRTTLDRPRPRHRSTNASGATRTHGGLSLIRFSPRRRRAREPGNTSAFIRVWALVVAVVVAALAVLLTYEVRQENSGLTVIGHQTAPVVEASTDLYLRLNDMDAQMANILLVGSAKNLGFTRAQALGIFESDRRQASTDLQEASAEATVDPAAALSIRALLNALGSYEALAAQVTLVSGQGSQPPGKPSPATLALYTRATKLLGAQLLPASQDLTNRNAAILQTTYTADRGQALTARNCSKDIEWTGYWGDEFRNFTFIGEPQAAELSLKRFQVYELDDRKIRELNDTGQFVAAIAFDTSYNPGESNWAFGQYDDAQVKVIDINVNAFNQAIKDGLHALDGWTVIPAGAGLAVLGLLLLGLRGRLAEYRMPVSGSAPAGTPVSTATEETG